MPKRKKLGRNPPWFTTLGWWVLTAARFCISPPSLGSFRARPYFANLGVPQLKPSWASNASTGPINQGNQTLLVLHQLFHDIMKLTVKWYHHNRMSACSTYGLRRFHFNWFEWFLYLTFFMHLDRLSRLMHIEICCWFLVVPCLYVFILHIETFCLSF